MKKNNPALFNELNNFILELNSLKKKGAFEVACGECHVSRHVLSKHFSKIDLLDRCPISLQHAQQLKEQLSCIDNIYDCQMQEFAWDQKWNCIVFRFCVGYPNDDQLIEILRKAKGCLDGRMNSLKRGAT